MIPAMDVENHPWEPFLPSNARLLMLGSFPPPRKRWSMDFYYPNWTNDMWRLVGLLFFGDKDYFVQEGKKAFCRERLEAFLREKGIALFDTASAVRRLQDNASDKFLQVVTPTDVGALLRRLPLCRAVVTTGEKATETLCAQFSLVKPCRFKTLHYLCSRKHGNSSVGRASVSKTECREFEPLFPCKSGMRQLHENVAASFL